jgi:copper chaperone CopZ
MNIDFALEDLSGVVAAQTHYAKQISKVTYDPKRTSVNKIIATIEKLGYAARVKEEIWPRSHRRFLSMVCTALRAHPSLREHFRNLLE